MVCHHSDDSRLVGCAGRGTRVESQDRVPVPVPVRDLLLLRSTRRLVWIKRPLAVPAADVLPPDVETFEHLDPRWY